MRLSRHDVYGFIGSLLIYGALTTILVHLPGYRHKSSQVVQFDVKHNELPPPPPPPPPQPKAKPRPSYIPNETPRPSTPPSTEPVKPVFGVSRASTTGGDSSFAVPIGNTTATDPRNTAPLAEVKPLSAPPPVAEFKAASPLEIKEHPEIIGQTCEIPSRLYPEEARQQGIEGDTKLHVEIDANGKVHNVRIISSSAKLLDDLALFWMRAHCKFKPARNSANQPVDFAISYTFHWQLDR